MTTIESYQLDELIDKNIIYRLSEQLKECDDTDDHKILSDELDFVRTKKYTHENPKEILTEKMNKVKEMLLRKKWDRLKDFQKEDRVKKFLSENNVSEKIQEKILKLLLDSKLRFFNCVEYDIETCSIKQIYCLTKDEKGKYHIDKSQIRNKEVNSKRTKKQPDETKE